MNVAVAEAIQGWMTHVELVWLAEQATCHQTIVEIGSWRGRSTRALGENTQGVVYAVDNWSASGGVYEAENLELVRAEFWRNCGDLIDCGKIVPLEMASVDAAMRLWKPKTIDMVFIDGNHSYQAVRSDLDAWAPKVKSGGLISGHDFWMPDVVQAVREVFPNIAVVADMTIWWVRV